MLLKIMSIFLVVMAVMAIFGKLRMPRVASPRFLKRRGRCTHCHRPKIGSGPCPCKEMKGN
ncbi:hypothetical protein BFP70_04595 [Thioclava sp. SK-1]|nr:hypothetical protein BFP70_04595 [Thioclava sp. SK-1]